MGLIISSHFNFLISRNKINSTRSPAVFFYFLCSFGNLKIGPFQSLSDFSEGRDDFWVFLDFLKVKKNTKVVDQNFFLTFELSEKRKRVGPPTKLSENLKNPKVI